MIISEIQQDVDLRLKECASDIINTIIENASKPIIKDHKTRILDEYNIRLANIKQKFQESFKCSDSDILRYKLQIIQNVIQEMIRYISNDLITDTKIHMWRRQLSNFGYEWLVSELYLISKPDKKFEYIPFEIELDEEFMKSKPISNCDYLYDDHAFDNYAGQEY